MREWVYYVNGRYLSAKRALISVLDRGFLFGDGFFETLRFENGEIFQWPTHVQRLRQAARQLEIKITRNPIQLKKVIFNLLKKNKLSTAYIRITFTRGIQSAGVDFDSTSPATIVIGMRPLKKLPNSFYQNGVDVCLVPFLRNHPLALDPAIKSLNFLNSIQGLHWARKRGFFEGVLLNSKRNITEGSFSNIFFTSRRVLKTPALKNGLLNGVTRQYVLKLAQRLGLTIQEGQYKIQDIGRMSECFLTNTQIGILPVKYFQRYHFSEKKRRITDLLRQNFHNHP